MCVGRDVPPDPHETAAPVMRPWGVVRTTLFGFVILLATDISQVWVLGPQLRPLDERLRQMEAEDPALSPDALREIARAYLEANNVDLVFYVSILVMALVMLLLTLVFVRLKGRRLLRPYLALYPVSLRAAVLGIGIVLAYQVGSWSRITTSRSKSGVQRTVKR